MKHLLLIAVFSLLSGLGHSAAFIGKVIAIQPSNYLTEDVYTVVLDTSATSACFSGVTFKPSNYTFTEAYKRTFTLLTMALATNKTVAVLTQTTDCDTAFGIEFQQ